ncbi:MAG: DUF945 family protein [Gammaproteobacteria bacterium]|jgi:hypothetical protein
MITDTATFRRRLIEGAMLGVAALLFAYLIFAAWYTGRLADGLSRNLLALGRQLPASIQLAASRRAPFSVSQRYVIVPHDGDFPALVLDQHIRTGWQRVPIPGGGARWYGARVVSTLAFGEPPAGRVVLRGVSWVGPGGVFSRWRPGQTVVAGPEDGWFWFLQDGERSTSSGSLPQLVLAWRGHRLSVAGLVWDYRGRNAVPQEVRLALKRLGFQGRNGRVAFRNGAVRTRVEQGAGAPTLHLILRLDDLVIPTGVLGDLKAGIDVDHAPVLGAWLDHERSQALQPGSLDTLLAGASLRVAPFVLKTDNGIIRGRANVVIPKPQSAARAADTGLQVRGDLAVSASLLRTQLENALRIRAAGRMAGELAAEKRRHPPPLAREEIDLRAAEEADRQLSLWLSQGYMQRDHGMYTTHFEWRRNRLSLNGLSVSGLGNMRQ